MSIELITRKRIAELRKAWPRDLQSSDLDAILDAAESAIELREQNEHYKKSIAITDVNFRAMQKERDALCVKLDDAVASLERCRKYAEDEIVHPQDAFDYEEALTDAQRIINDHWEGKTTRGVK